MERCSASLIIRVMQTKTTMRCHLASVRMAIKKNQKNKRTSAGEDVEKREPSYTVNGNVNRCNHYGKQYGGSS